MAEMLTSQDHATFTKAWTEMFYNETAVFQLLTESTPESMLQVIEAGKRYDGSGWNTTTCARAVRQLTNVALVVPRVEEYLHSFLYSLALASDVAIAEMSLSDRAAEAAFVLADRWTSALQAQTRTATAVKLGSARAQNPNSENAAEEKMDEEDEEVVFDWEEVREHLSPDLLEILKRANRGERLDVKNLLLNVPLWAELKVKPEENNHRQDAKASFDKVLKSTQQKVLHALRVLALLHTAVPELGGEAQ